MLIRHTIFHCELFSWFIFLAECKILNFFDAGRRRRTVSLHGSLPCYQLNGLILPVMSIFYLKVSFYQYFIVCLCSTNLRLHNPCWLATVLSDVCLQW